MPNEALNDLVVTIVAPCCRRTIHVDVSVFEAVATRCTECGTALSSRELISLAEAALLESLGAEPESTCLDENLWLAKGEVRALLAVHGLACCRNTIEEQLAMAIRREAEAALAAALLLPPNKASDVLTCVRGPTRRYDIRLELSVTLLSLLRQLLAKDAPVGMAVEEGTLVCEDSKSGQHAALTAPRLHAVCSLWRACSAL